VTSISQRGSAGDLAPAQAGERGEQDQDAEALAWHAVGQVRQLEALGYTVSLERAA
jgi:hypothetical protein